MVTFYHILLTLFFPSFHCKGLEYYLLWGFRCFTLSCLRVVPCTPGRTGRSGIKLSCSCSYQLLQQATEKPSSKGNLLNHTLRVMNSPNLWESLQYIYIVERHIASESERGEHMCYCGTIGINTRRDIPLSTLKA